MVTLLLKEVSNDMIDIITFICWLCIDVPALALHCTPQWNATDQSFTVYIEFNVSNEFTHLLSQLIIEFKESFKSNGNVKSHGTLGHLDANVSVRYKLLLLLLVLLLLLLLPFSYVEWNKISKCNSV